MIKRQTSNLLLFQMLAISMFIASCSLPSRQLAFQLTPTIITEPSSTATPTPTPTLTHTSTPPPIVWPTDTPAQTATVTNMPMPTPTNTAPPTPSFTPTPDLNINYIRGIVIQGDRQPVPAASVCLVALQPQTTRGYCDDTDAEGRFQITNIEPGDYSLSWDDDLTNSYAQGKLVTINEGSQLEEVLVSSKATPETVALRKEIEISGRSLAFSPDDKLLAIGGRNGIQVWQTESWSQLWAGETNTEVWEVAFSSDGKRLATVGGFSATTAHLWEAMSGGLMAQLSHPDWRGGLLGLDFSADGQLLAVGGSRKILIADATTGHPIYDLTYDLQLANELVFSPNGQWLAGLFQNAKGPGKLMVWDVVTREERTLATFLVPTSNLVFSPDAHWLAVGEPVNAVWETGIWSEPISLASPEDPNPVLIDKVIFSPDGRWLVGLVSSEIWMWDVSTWQSNSKIRQAGKFWDVALSPDGQWLAAGFEGQATNEGQLWQTTSGELVGRMPHAGQALEVVFSHRGNWIAIGGSRGVTVWELVSAGN